MKLVPALEGQMEFIRWSEVGGRTGFAGQGKKWAQYEQCVPVGSREGVGEWGVSPRFARVREE